MTFSTSERRAIRPWTSIINSEIPIPMRLLPFSSSGLVILQIKYLYVVNQFEFQLLHDRQGKKSKMTHAHDVHQTFYVRNKKTGTKRCQVPKSGAVDCNALGAAGR